MQYAQATDDEDLPKPPPLSTARGRERARSIAVHYKRLAEQLAGCHAVMRHELRALDSVEGERLLVMSSTAARCALALADKLDEAAEAGHFTAL